MICPLMSYQYKGGDTTFRMGIDCLKEKCAWWVDQSFYKLDMKKHVKAGDCAIKLLVKE